MIDQVALIEFVRTASPCLVINAPRRSGKTEYLKKQIASLRAHDSELFFRYVALTTALREDFYTTCGDLLMKQTEKPYPPIVLVIDEAAYFNEKYFFDLFFDTNIARIIIISTIRGPPHSEKDNIIMNELAFLGFEFIDAPLL